MSLCLWRGPRLLSNSHIQGEHPCKINNGAPLLKKISFIVTFDPTTIIFDSCQYQCTAHSLLCSVDDHFHFNEFHMNLGSNNTSVLYKWPILSETVLWFITAILCTLQWHRKRSSHQPRKKQLTKTVSSNSRPPSLSLTGVGSMGAPGACAPMKFLSRTQCHTSLWSI